jgi:DNA polymerase III subunit beta
VKISIQQNLLSKAINVVQRGVSSRSTLPILSGILLRAVNGELILTGTDLELGIETRVECNVVEEGGIVLTSKLFGEVIKKLPSEEIYLEADLENNVHINCGNSKFNILGQAYEEYPQLPELDKEKSFHMSKDLLKSMIKQTIFATAQDETRPILTGALLEIENSESSLIALDGYRLALKKVKINYEGELKVVIPAKTLSEVSKIVDEDESDVKISTTENHIIFSAGPTVITSRLLEGQFLNYRDIIRSEYKTKAIVNTKELQSSIERASLLAREGKNNLIKLDMSDDTVVITSNSEVGDVYENIPATLEGDSIQIAFNSKYILDGIRAIESENIELYLTSNVNPCIMKPSNDESYTYLVLPVRLA